MFYGTVFHFATIKKYPLSLESCFYLLQVERQFVIKMLIALQGILMSVSNTKYCQHLLTDLRPMFDQSAIRRQQQH